MKGKKEGGRRGRMIRIRYWMRERKRKGLRRERSIKRFWQKEKEEEEDGKGERRRGRKKKKNKAYELLLFYGHGMGSLCGEIRPLLYSFLVASSHFFTSVRQFVRPSARPFARPSARRSAHSSVRIFVQCPSVRLSLRLSPHCHFSLVRYSDRPCLSKTTLNVAWNQKSKSWKAISTA